LCRDALEGIDVQVGFGQKSFELAVLQLQFAQPFGLSGIHAGVLGAPFVKRRITETVFTPKFLDRHAGFDLPQTNDLLFAEFACSHVHHSPG
jgi:hypothetical protein